MSYPIGTPPIKYQGIVEDRMDPLEIGRVRVRVFGIHSPDLSLVPTSSLPWATVELGVDGGGNSGLGWSPVGIVPGTMVWVYFADGEEFQVPVVTGICPGVNDSIGMGDTSSPIVVDNSTGSAPAQTTQTANTKAQTAAAKTSNWVLGQTSEKYETGGAGVSTISTGWLDKAHTQKDPGGKSYGPWQLASQVTKRDGTVVQVGSTLDIYIKQSKWRENFRPYPLTSDGFDYAWKNICNTEGQAFRDEQYQFIYDTHYSPEMAALSSLGLDTRGPGVQDCVWSMAVQHGHNARKYISQALAGKTVPDMSDADIVTLAMQYRMQKFPQFKAGRYDKELKDLLALCSDTTTDASKTPAKPSGKDAYGQPTYSAPNTTPAPAATTSSSKGSFRDPSGAFPRKGYKGLVDTNKLARNYHVNTTIVQKKKTVVKGNGFNEPPTPYAAKYPYNKVFESESGHIIEIDDTPGAERLHTYHKSGSFMEHHPDGTVVFKSVKDKYEVVMGKYGLYVTGDVLIVVEGNAKMKIMGNYDVQAQGNIKMMAQGTMELLSAQSFKAGAVGPATITSGAMINLDAPVITENGGGSASVQIDPLTAVNAALGAADEEPPVDVDDESAVGLGSGITDPRQLPYQVPPDPAGATTKRTISVAQSKVDDSTLGDKFSKYYTIEEVTTSTVFPATLQDQATLTADQIYDNLKWLARNVLDPIAEHYGKTTFTITSALRAANGSHSHHVQGAAADLQFSGVAVSEYPHLAEQIRQLLPAFSQLILEYHSKNPVIHIAYSRGDSYTPLSKANGDIKMCFTTFTPDFKPWRVDGNGFYSKDQQLIYTV